MIEAQFDLRLSAVVRFGRGRNTSSNTEVQD
jgi:hypothetical protein